MEGDYRTPSHRPISTWLTPRQIEELLSSIVAKGGRS